MHEACVEACEQAAGLFGPAGYVAIIVLSFCITAWSRIQVVRERGAKQVAETKAETLHTALVSLRPDAAPTIEQALRAPRVPVEVVAPSSTSDEEGETKP